MKPRFQIFDVKFEQIQRRRTGLSCSIERTKEKNERLFGVFDCVSFNLRTQHGGETNVGGNDGVKLHP